MSGHGEVANVERDGTTQYLMRVRSMAKSSSSGFERLARYIADNVDETVNLTMEQLAQKSGASYATIYRFCVKLGLSGYKELKARLIEEMVAPRGGHGPTAVSSIDESSDTAQILDRVFDFAASTLSDCRSILDARTVDAAVAALSNATMVLIVGQGASGVAANYAFTKLVRLGVRCSAETDGMMIATRCATLGDQDVLLAVSSSGRTSEIVSAAEAARGTGATVISISDYAVSPLAALTDISLHTTPRNANLYREVELPLMTGQIAVIDSLFSCMAVRGGSAAADVFRRTRRAIDGKRM